PSPAPESRGRMHVSATVDGSSFYEVTFYAKVGNGDWQPIGTDDSAPYQVFQDTSGIPSAPPVQYRPVVLGNGRNHATTNTRATDVPPARATHQGAGGGHGRRGPGRGARGAAPGEAHPLGVVRAHRHRPPRAPRGDGRPLAGLPRVRHPERPNPSRR